MTEPAPPPTFDPLSSHEEALLRYAAHLLGHPSRAADVVQDTFARFWAQDDATRQRLCETHDDPAAPPCHNPDRRLRAWLFTVCRNRAFDIRRKDRRMTPLTAPLADSRIHPEPGPAHLAEQRDSHDAVLRRLTALPDTQQEVVRLKFQADLSYKQIAAVTGLTVSHVGVLLHQALKTLRRDMTAIE